MVLVKLRDGLAESEHHGYMMRNAATDGYCWTWLAPTCQRGYATHYQPSIEVRVKLVHGATGMLLYQQELRYEDARPDSAANHSASYGRLRFADTARLVWDPEMLSNALCGGLDRPAEKIAAALGSES